MAEFADLGAHCHYDLCKQQNFLPFDCEHCKHKFCEHHRNPVDHECKHVPQAPKSQTFSKRKKLRCKVKGCKVKIGLMLIRCNKCNGGFCTTHRHADTHDCPRDVTSNHQMPDDDEKVDEIHDNRWVFVKNQLSLKWNKNVLNALQTEIGEQEYDFDDVVEDFGEYSVEDNNSGLMDHLMERFEWEDGMALDFHKAIQSAFENAPQLETDGDGDQEHDDDDGEVRTEEAKKELENATEVAVEEKNKMLTQQQKKNIVQWIYNELTKHFAQSQVMEMTNKVIRTIMNDELDDQMEYQLWEMLGGYSSPKTFIQNIKDNRKVMRQEIEKLHTQ